jgi:hypothetical protein
MMKRNAGSKRLIVVAILPSNASGIRPMLPSRARLAIVATFLAFLPVSVVRAAEGISPVMKQAPLVFAATLRSAQAGPVANSFPPIYTYRLIFEKAEKPLRGALPEKGTVFAFSHRAVDPPVLNVGERYLVAARISQGAQVVELRPASDELVDQMRAALALPIGWEMKNGKPVSPWAQRGEQSWPQGSALIADAKCSISDRPALLAGEGIEMKVEQIPPKERQEFKNPFGDGQFKITIANTGKMAVTVPALIKDGDEIRWHESLVIVCRDKPYLLPSTGALNKPLPVELAPGESVSTTVDTLLLDGDVPWPRGGSRIMFTFALGETAADNFFYYFSNLHDAMRSQRVKDFTAKQQ